ncbi:nicotinate phosphoribosyltransferase [Deltaproteobacteria bacterium Smac51]|nr:nicotinate phosphoribosyltransferase [Deltaproteobacteria bacterium Smac51]
MDRQIISHFTDNEVYSFSGCYLYLNKFPRAHGRYTLIDRDETVYPPGFGRRVAEQIKAMESVIISDEEIAFMQRTCQYFPTWFYTFLRGYRFSADEVEVIQDNDGRLHITVEGLLWKIVFWEVPILAIISELKHEMTGFAAAYEAEREYADTLDKGRRLLENGLSFAECGTSRRFSFAHQGLVIRGLIEAGGQTAGEGEFLGTSNICFSKKFNLTPVGVINHQLISFCGAIFGYKEANFLAMKYWQEAFDSDLGTFIYDTFGWNAFQENFSKKYAKLFEGLRVDSGDNFEAIDKIVAKYEELNINPRTKCLTFSNGLGLEQAIEIHQYCRGKIGDNYDIGSFLTCDVAGVDPVNMVMKLTAAKLTEKKNWQKAIKLSDDAGKFSGDPDEVDIARKTLNMDGASDI